MMDSTLLNSLVISSPGAAAVIITVIVFIRYLRARETEQTEALKTIGDACHEVQRESHEVMREVTASLGQTAEALRRLNG